MSCWYESHNECYHHKNDPREKVDQEYYILKIQKISQHTKSILVSQRHAKIWNTCATLCSEKKNVKQYVEDAIAKPYSNRMRTVGNRAPLPINCSKPKNIRTVSIYQRCYWCKYLKYTLKCISNGSWIHTKYVKEKHCKSGRD